MMYLVRFDAILDAYARQVLEGSGAGFSRNSSGEYVSADDALGSESFGRGLEKFAIAAADVGGGPLSPDWFFVLGDCRPEDNVWLGLGGKPAGECKYALTEDDIKVDLLSFNRRADETFRRLFRRDARMPAKAFAVAHRRLGAETLRAFLKSVFGRPNCEDADAAVLSGRGRCLLSANDAVEQSVPDKAALNRLPEARRIMDELRQYVGECTGMDWSA